MTETPPAITETRCKRSISIGNFNYSSENESSAEFLVMVNQFLQKIKELFPEVTQTPPKQEQEVSYAG